MSEQTTTPKTGHTSIYIKLMFVGLIMVGLTLPFHYVPSRLIAFPKEHLTFSNTIITQSDIDQLIERHNSSLFDALDMMDDPLCKKLIEKGVIGSDETSDEDYSFEGSDVPHGTLATLSEFEGQYTFDVDFLENKALMKRAVDLIGRTNYQVLLDKWNVTSPIEYEDGVLVASAGEQHNAYSTNFIILCDLYNDVLQIGMKVDDAFEVFSENGTTHEKISQWRSDTEQSMDELLQELVDEAESYQPKSVFDASELYGFYKLTENSETDQSLENALYEMEYGSSIATMEFRGHGVGKIHVNLFGFIETTPFEYTQEGNTLIIANLGSAEKTRYEVLDMKGDHEYLRVRKSDNDTEFIFLKE